MNSVMKANEIQIGDWVEPCQCMVPTVYCKVEGIYPDGTVHLDKAERLFALDELKSIPITPEILEKNFPIANGCQYIDNNNDVCIEVYFNAITEKGKKYAILYTNRGKIYIDKYVHQLQHALRLCGIEKEIIL